MGLTARQLEAVAVEATPRDTCVVAGPGSGKTTVLVAYFEQLVESGVDPLRILAITFTDKAANNMRDKLARKFQDRARDPRQAGARLRFHGARVLRPPAEGERGFRGPRSRLLCDGRARVAARTTPRRR